MIKPAWLARNLTPSSTADESLAAAVLGTVLLGQIVQGHPLADAAVVNDQVTGSIGLFALSFAPARSTV